jgi:endonuclease/exonuclease/phosphatase (EEP) superfamily protein YafD
MKMTLKARLRQELKTIDVRNVLAGVARPIFIPVLIGSLLSYLGGTHQVLELTTHFRWQYLCVGFLTLLLYAFTKRRWEIGLCLFCLGLNAIDVLPWYLPTASPTFSGQPLRVMVANVLTTNKRYDQFVQYVQQEQPAVVVVMEMDAVWQKKLQGLKSLLPYAIEVPSEDNFGIALFSKYPLEHPQQRDWGAGAYVVPSLSAAITIDQKLITLVATHPLPPLKPDYFTFRNQHMAELANYVKQLDHRAIVMGDLNMSMWSPYFRQFMHQTHLKSSRQGFGVQASWPADAPLLQIPIDHRLVSPQIQVIKNRIGPDIGSDHYPLITDLGV